MAARTSATERVFATLRENILSGRLEPGTQHSIYRMAEELGVSRTPVREAVLRLADAGLVTVERNRGVRVRGVSVQDVLDVFDLRLLLEIPATAFAARAADDEQKATISRCLDAMRAAAEADEPQEFDAHDRSLHGAIHAVTGNARLADEVRSLRASIQSRGAVTLHRSRGMAEILEEHVPVVEAVLAGDVLAATALMRDHLVHTAVLLARQLDPDADVETWVERTAAFVVGDHLLDVEPTPTTPPQ